jgi:polyhydroxyalkanoate synthesis regulator phasin
MTFTDDVQRYADAIMAMIKEDQDTGQVPRNVCSWDELDESVDAADYYRQARMTAGTRNVARLRSAVNDEVGRRLAKAVSGR